MNRTIEKEELPFEVKIYEEGDISSPDNNIEKSSSNLAQEIDEGVKISLKNDFSASNENKKFKKEENPIRNKNLNNQNRRNKTNPYHFQSKIFDSSTYLHHEIEKLVKEYDIFFFLSHIRKGLKDIPKYNDFSELKWNNKEFNSNILIEFFKDWDDSQDEKILLADAEISNKNEKLLIEEVMNLRNLDNLNDKEKIKLELNIDKIGLNTVILNKNYENENIDVMEEYLKDRPQPEDSGKEFSRVENATDQRNIRSSRIAKKEQDSKNEIVKKNPSKKGLLNEKNLKNKIADYVNKLNNTYKDNFLATHNIIDIETLLHKAKNDYFISIDEVLVDIIFLFKYINANIELYIPTSKIENRKKYKLYLNNLYFSITQKVASMTKIFNNNYRKDLKYILETNMLPRKMHEKRTPPVKKEYEVIEDYEHKKEQTLEKIKTKLKPNCKGTCCESYQDLGPLNLQISRWDGNCNDRKNNIECDPEICGCDEELCKNQDIRKKLDKKLNKDVQERYAWGIDLYTYRNFLEFLPKNFTEEYKSFVFIENTLIRSLSLLKKEGYKIKKALENIIGKYISDSFIEEKQNENDLLPDFPDILNSMEKQKLLADIFCKLNIDPILDEYKDGIISSPNNYYLAIQLLKVLNSNFIGKDPNLIFEAYSKGIGIYCIKGDGIKMNEYISGYFGEIYPPWLWFEKQDIIKSNKLENNLPDFYNIMLERQKFDEDGYDVLMVDPNSKGNFASRMSHSCVPNCNTVLMVSEGKYTIGMFATKDIEFGEELTFDYNSFTEKEQEFKEAICLCSSFSCRGNYLTFSKSLTFTEVLNKYHNFLHRNAILLYACFYHDYKSLTEEEVVLLNQFSIKNSILKKAPFWLKKWCVMILKFIDLESKLLPFYLYKAANPEQFISDDKRNLDYVSELVPILNKGLKRNKKNSSLSSRSNNTDKYNRKSFKNGELNNEDLSNCDFHLNLDEKDESILQNNVGNSNNFESNAHETMVSTCNGKMDVNKIKHKKLKKEGIRDNEPKNFEDNFIYYAKKYESKSRGKNKEKVTNQSHNKMELEKSSNKAEIDRKKESEKSVNNLNFQNSYLTNQPEIDILDIEIQKKSESSKVEKIPEESKNQFEIKGDSINIQIEQILNRKGIIENDVEMKLHDGFDLNNQISCEYNQSSVINLNNNFDQKSIITNNISENEESDKFVLLGKKRGNDSVKSSINSNKEKKISEISIGKSEKLECISLRVDKEIKKNYSDLTPDNNLFYINLKDSSQTNSPENIEKSDNINNILSKSFLYVKKTQKEIKNFEKNMFRDIDYKHLEDLKQFLIPYAKTLKEITLKEVIDSNSFKDAEFQTTGVIDCRIQNLAITIDKVINVMRISKDDKPPLVKLTTKEIIENLWTHGYSLRYSLINNIEILKKNSLLKGLGHYIEELDLILEILNNNYTNVNQFEDLFFKNKSENIYELIKMVKKFINENIKVKSKEDFYLENKEALDQDFFDIIDRDNSLNNKFCFSFKNFNVKSHKQVDKISEEDLLNEKNAYWVNTKYISDKDRRIKIKAENNLKIVIEETKNKTNSKIFDIGKNNKGSRNQTSSLFIDLPILNAKSDNLINYSNDSKSAHKAKERNKIKKKTDDKDKSDKKFLDDLAKMSSKEENTLLQSLKNVFKFISLVIKFCHYKEIVYNKNDNSKLIYFEGLSDMLYLHSCTQIYFKHNDAYGKQVESQENITIRDRDVNVYEDDVNNKHLEEKIHTGCKIYDKMYIWGQLVGWFKQTVDKPNASLSAERRGSLVYPELDSFFFQNNLNKSSKKASGEKEVKYKEFEKVFEYPYKTREKFFNKLIENPAVMWPLGNDWSFKNNRRIYGSVQFDSVLKSGIINPNEIAEKEQIATAFKHILLGDSIYKNNINYLFKDNN